MKRNLVLQAVTISLEEFIQKQNINPQLIGLMCISLGMACLSAAFVLSLSLL